MPSRAPVVPSAARRADGSLLSSTAVFTNTCVLALVLALQSGPLDGQPTPPPEDRPIHDLFPNLGRDLIAVPSVDTAIIIGSSIGAALAARPVDDNLQMWVDEQGPADHTRVGQIAGDGWVQGGGALATYGIGLLAGHRATAHVGSDLIRAQALTGVFTHGLKIGIGRARPSGGSHSMPSGHTSASFATAAVLERHFGLKVGLPAYAAAGFVGWTRVRDNAHWLTDVIIGGALGTAIGRTVARGHRQTAWTLVPTAGRTHVALMITRVGR